MRASSQDESKSAEVSMKPSPGQTPAALSLGRRKDEWPACDWLWAVARRKL